MRRSSPTGVICAGMVCASAINLLASDDFRLADAAKNQNKDAVRALLKQRIDVNAPQRGGTTALHWAAHWDDVDTAALLIGAGANVNARTDLGVTPLYVAAEIGSAVIVERLLAAGADPNLSAATGVSPLMLASRAGALDAAKALLAHGANVNANENANGQTALMWAVAQRHPHVVSLLVEHGAEVHARSRIISKLVNRGGLGDGNTSAVEMMETGGSTALMFAARNGSIESARVLLGFGANVDDTGADGNSVLVVAAHSGHGALAAFLLDRGANPNADGAGYTVLHAAVLRGDLDLVKSALAHGANPNVRLTKGTPFRRSSADYFLPTSLMGATPVLLAARFASADMMRVLAVSGADVHLPANDGTTPLIAAANSDRRRQLVLTYARPEDIVVADERQGLEAVKLLLEWGADVNAVNQAGNTALHVAASGQSNSIVQLLAEGGAILEVKNKLGQTPLALALPRRRGAGEGSQTNSTTELLRKLGAKQ